MNSGLYTIGSLLENAATLHGNKIAIKQKQSSVSYADLYEDSLKLKGFIRDIGISRGDRIGIYINQSIDQILAMFAVSMAGGIFVFINPVLKKNQIEHIISDCQIEFLITDDNLVKNSQLTTPRTTIDMGVKFPKKGYYSWTDARKDLQADHTDVLVCSDDIACLIYTSGSTGLSKGVAVPHRTVVDGAKIVSSYLEITARDRILSVLPINFDYGLNQVVSSILHGATLILHKFLMPKDLFNILQEERITGFPGMPPIWSKIFNEKLNLSTKLNFPELRYLTNTGGKVPKSTVDRIKDFFQGADLFLMYGLTEAFRSTYLPPEELDRRPDSIGKAIPNVEILVVNDAGTECSVGEVGELVHRGSLVTFGYWNDVEKTGNTFRNNPRFSNQSHLHETVVYSGDLVKKDAEGFLYFISRSDELIKSSGYRVSPYEVEEVITEIPGISSAIVFGMEIETGEQVIAAILETSHTIETSQDIMRECHLRLPTYMIPKELYFEKEFPKTANGKIDRSGIKAKILNTGVFYEAN